MRRFPAGLGFSTERPSMDFETYSEAGFVIDPGTGKVRGIGPQGKGGLPVVGTPVYAEHPSTEALCLNFDLKEGRGRRGWILGTPSPFELLDHIRRGGEIEAWNITFEFWIWNMVCTRKYGWPALPLEQCYCVMAKSRRYSLPGKLANAANVLGTVQKDKDGGRLIQRLTRPHTPTKNRPEHRWTPATAWDDFLKLYQYCDVDVQCEDAAAARIPDLTPSEFRAWRVDQTINVRGVQVDVPALDAMLDILGQAERKYNAELALITGGEYDKVTGQIIGGAVRAATELPQLKIWLETRGVLMPDMQKDTIADVVKAGRCPVSGRAIPGPAMRTLEIRQVLGAANVKKLRTLKLQVSSDGRLRDQYMYCGADRTGRACIAEGEPVLVKTKEGDIMEVPIQLVTKDMLLWDGLEWVKHGGVTFSGVREVIDHDDVSATPDHRVFISSTEYRTLAFMKENNASIYRGEVICPTASTD